MASLDSFDIGTSSSGAEQLLAELKDSCITKLTAKLKDNADLKAALKEAWVGADEEIYERNLDQTIANCCTSVDGIYATFDKEIRAIDEAMNSFRASHVEERTY